MKKGFTLIELILVVAIVALIAGMLIPVITGVRQEARVAKILYMYETLRTACQDYYEDTAQYAMEGSRTAWCFMPVDCGNGLSNDSGQPNWDGPYISERVKPKASPFQCTGRARPLEPFWVNSIANYDDDNDGYSDRNGPGNTFVIRCVPEAAAKKINNILDEKWGQADWENTGRVIFDPNLPTKLEIFVFGKP